DGSTGGLVGAMVDITERKKAEETINYLAHFDPATDLPNQTLFQRRLALELAESKQRQDTLAVLNLDIDQFKKLTSAFGQQTGDKLLRQVATRLSHNLRADDTIAKVGDDIFMVLLPRITEEEEAAQVATELLDNLRQAFMLEGQEIFITASIGIALFPLDGLEPQDLIKSSTSAMHRAKDVGRNGYQFHSPELTARTREEIDLEYQLYKALERDELLLYYQPIIEAQSNRIVAVEALLRWHHPKLGLLPPGRFIHLAEKTGLIVGIGEWVLRTACCQGRAWQDMGAAPLRIGVNLSPRQFQQPDLFQSISEILFETGLPPERLSIEITENILMNNVEKAVETLSSLKRLGVHLAIDDFGTGYSSLNYIKRFPFDMLKIDRSFVSEIPDHADDLAIISAVVAMAETLQLSVLAEGVENDQQRQILCEQGCQELQGYLFSFPLPADEIQRLLFAHSPPRQSFAAAVEYPPPYRWHLQQ
ncbi:MAG TPA: bifunctional diguanylate cyclase/phosphodiesterase, partial [Desulfuromonadales bacterium]|nr:bifunctional diguanylate cyclase/phosphodiesterase [Desulfuromonadales bacterium]